MPRHPDIKAIEDQIEELRKSMAVRGKEIFAAETAALFEKFPAMETFAWRQYTPYFNDGDTCYFRACIDNDSIFINGRWGNNCELTDEEEPMAKEISDMLYSIGSDNLEQIFGDHMEITVHRNGRVDTEGYEHR